MSARRYALVAGGGTAGHALPALAVARALAARRGADEVELVGSRRGLEATLLPDAGLPYTLLPGRGIVRRADVASLAANARAAGGLAVASLRALGLVARRRPAVVVAVGGFASVPAGLAAVALGVPLVLVNVDAVPGAANRLLSRFARAAAVALPGTALPRAVVTGAPTRPEIAAVDRADGAARGAARRALGVAPDGVLVAAFGGSLGARRINEAVAELAERWADRQDRALYHVVGRRDALPGDAEGGGTGARGSRYVRVAYEDRMDRLYQAADVVVSRAGAMTVAELSITGVPAVLVPLPGAPDDHQGANAGVLARAGAAVVLPDEECSGERLAQMLDELAESADRRAAMEAAARALGNPRAAEAIATVAEAHARARRGGARRAHELVTEGTVTGAS